MPWPTPGACLCSEKQGCQFRKGGTNGGKLCRENYGIELLSHAESQAKKAEARKAVRKLARQRRRRENGGGQATL